MSLKISEIKDAKLRERILSADAIQNGRQNHPRAGLPNTEQRQLQRPLESSREEEASGSKCPVARFILYRVRLLDVDAKYHSVKDLLDGLAIAGLIPGDKEGQITLEVKQEKVGSWKEEMTVIEVEL